MARAPSRLARRAARRWRRLLPPADPAHRSRRAAMPRRAKAARRGTWSLRQLLAVARRSVKADLRRDLGPWRHRLVRHHRIGAVDYPGADHRREGADLGIIGPHRLVIVADR